MRDSRTSSDNGAIQYVGAIIGESTSREFRLAIAHEAVREQDIIAVDVAFQSTEQRPDPETLRVWAKVQCIERLNPLFPTEAGHELAGSMTNPFDTVVSLSREMVTTVCQVLGSESLTGGRAQRLSSLRYPPQPVSQAYRPPTADIKRVLIGELAENQGRSLDIATLSTRNDIDVAVDGHAIVTRHLAILAMTGAGKSWAARRIIEELAAKNYPIVIFDPHGDYTGLAEVPGLQGRVQLIRAQLPIFDESAENARLIVEGLAAESMSSPQIDGFNTLFAASSKMLNERSRRSTTLQELLFEITGNDNIRKFGLNRDLFALSYIAEATNAARRTGANASWTTRLAELGFNRISSIRPQQADSFRVLSRQLRAAAFELRGIEQINEHSSPKGSRPLPANRLDLVQHGQITVIGMAGYPDSLKATQFALLANQIFRARIDGKVRYPFMFVLEEAHNFVPAQSDDIGVQRSIAVTKQIAQEGRKFNIGLLLISQRPSRLDETTLAMCNSFIIMRMINPTDQQFVRRVIESLGEDEARLLPDLDVGEAILSGQMVNFPVLVKMKEPASRGEREEEDAFEVLRKAHTPSMPPR